MFCWTVSERSLWYDGTRHARPIRNFRIGTSLSNRIRIGTSDSNSNRISKLRKSLQHILDFRIRRIFVTCIFEEYNERHSLQDCRSSLQRLLILLRSLRMHRGQQRNDGQNNHTTLLLSYPISLFIIYNSCDYPAPSFAVHKLRLVEHSSRFCID